jgi:hypothetical protein
VKAVWLAAGLSTGCALSVAPTLGTTLAPQNQRLIGGARFEGALQVARDSGLTVVGAHQTGWTVGEVPLYAPDQWRYALGAGYSWAPLPHRGRIGFDAAALAEWGRVPVGGIGRPAAGGSVRVGMPVRLAGSREMWDAEEPLGAFLSIAPNVTLGSFVPLGDGVTHTPRGILEVGLAARVQFWSSLLP